MPNYAELLDTLREEAAYGLDLAFLEDDARMLALLKTSADRIARDAEVYDPAVTLTPVASQATYAFDSAAFSRPVHSVISVLRDGEPISAIEPIGALRHGIVSPGMVRRVYVAPRSLVFSPAPSAAEALRLFHVEALVLANKPQAEGENPVGLPEDLAEVVPLAALLKARTRSTESEQFARLDHAERTVERAIAKHRAESRIARFSLGGAQDRRVTR